jgi:hypothetical protein
MKKKIDEIRPEYDLSTLQGCVRGKYADLVREGSNVIILDKDVADVFKDDKAVNEALRTLIRLSGNASFPKKSRSTMAV